MRGAVRYDRPMEGLLSRLLSIGADATDDADTRLRKVLLLVAALIIAPLAVVWGLLYWIGGAPVAALIPWAYSLVSLIGILAFAATRHYMSFAVSQVVPYMILPFLLMWTLGGPVQGSGVALWAGLGPIVALLLGHRRLGTLLAAVYAALIVVSVVVPAPSGVTPPPWLVTLFLVLNLAGVPLVAWLLVRVFAGGREGVLESVRSMARRYLPTELVLAATVDPRRLELGGEIAEVTVLFADLGGYSTYAENRPPTEVVALLNRYFALILPAILDEGGTPIQLPGDAVMAVFGAPIPHADHPLRACRAARRMRSAIDAEVAGSPDPEGAPRFRIGVNTGPGLVGNIGSEDFRNFTVIGDTTNVAQRLQSSAALGQIVIGPTTAAALGKDAALTAIPPVRVKGREQSVQSFVLE